VSSSKVVTEKFEDICELVTDGTHDSPELQSDGVPFIKGKHISSGIIDFDNCDYISEEDHKKVIKRVKPQKGDILFSNIGSVGDTARINSNIEFSIKNVALFRANERKIDASYLYYLVRSPQFRNKALQLVSGSAQPFISLANLRGFEVSYFSDKQKQQKIASILSAFDDLIENNSRRIEILEEMARRIYREWFVHFHYPGHEKDELVDSGTELGEIPEGWEVKKLKNIIDLTYGKGLRKKDRVEGKYPVYGSSGIIDWHNDYHVEGPGVIVGRKGNVGSMFWEYENFNPIDTTYYVETELPLTYAFYNLHNQNFINSDAAVPGLSKRQASTLPVLVPDKDILKDFDSKLFQLFDLKSVIETKNEKLKETRDLLLPKLISGGIDVEEMKLAI